jgi:hypothetical protein
MSDAIEALKCDLRSRLATVTPTLLSGMLALLRTPIRELNLPWQAAEFEVDPMFYGVHAIALDEPLIPELIPSAIPFDVLEATEAAGISTDQLLGDLVMEWLADAWEQAGGAAFPYPGQAFFHDYPRRYDLTTRQWLAG